ncbi:uncharacterized protein MONBRDRAFT_8535 [Monosiga brevicollis MX1]|uniref:Uncharacterized protein n=1 Tax=Monosiga brevicollis TaxID=81824 RepID=A9V0B4_MONBE|nr:uncharacterized protein MONBRDRAFT_8535 [Monosiga brevicollis MX1]EDQ88980.1 predicted protein [Monosiga brevicollis MX1]|eukprot:XP_001746085.1 hypothetical protein [Monosiga brevicollis MX1]
MGGYFSSNADNRTNGNNATGNHGMYFGNQFTMGGESFQSMSPEAFLFGDISELSWLSRVPGSVPRVPNTVRHTNTVRCLVNVHKNSLRLIRHARNDSPVDAYHLSFTFDADCACTVVIHTFVEEAFDKHGNLKASFLGGLVRIAELAFLMDVLVLGSMQVDGRSFLLREIYGLERKVQEEGEDNNGDNDDDDDDESIDCVVGTRFIKR